METVATIIAILLGPILAVQVQKLIERIAQRKEEKRKLFITLMSTRGRTMSLEHVQALNLIDAVFTGSRDKPVTEAWRELNSHFNSYPEAPKPPPNGEIPAEQKMRYEAEQHAWTGQKDELLVTLLTKMADSLDYHFDRVLLKKGAYTPRGFDEVEMDQRVIQRGMAEVLLGLRSFPMKVTETPPNEESHNAIMAFLQGKQPLPVRIDGLSGNLGTITAMPKITNA